ncbi:type II toxin-antitoxin system RelE/ParE family toxin [Tepidimonas taiwanensis]|uniref:type II toxin-antitoxin system RelE/ParE family toxin n=1 Tax=Tepidimonas taiwanensis TaxID=307486 RepID=UPI00068BA074|nr:type II toxin-antitoxin system RelE/ParE family toxin [Tepidimonas taiwanensis]UBQ06335.1 type II toxin-antitoxin system RelE/ParE family toxin [Tepidimonas taiwanensis]
MKSIVPREQALRDVDDAIAYYLCEGGEALALNSIYALECAYARIRAHPATGSSLLMPFMAAALAAVPVALWFGAQQSP